MLLLEMVKMETKEEIYADWYYGESNDWLFSNDEDYSNENNYSNEEVNLLRPLTPWRGVWEHPKGEGVAP